jgi:hypothetical protein
VPAGHAIKSEAQRRFLHAAAGRGEIPKTTVSKMEHETKPSVKARLPYHKKHATVLDLLKTGQGSIRNRAAYARAGEMEFGHLPPGIGGPVHSARDLARSAGQFAGAVSGKAERFRTSIPDAMSRPAPGKITFGPGEGSKVRGSTAAIRQPGGEMTPGHASTEPPPFQPKPVQGHGAMKTADADRSAEKYEGVNAEGKVKNNDGESTAEAENYFGHGKGAKEEKPSIARGALIGAGVGALPGLAGRLGMALTKTPPKWRQMAAWNKLLADALTATGAVGGAATGVGIQAIRRASHEDKEKTAMEFKPFDKLAGRKDGNFFKDQAGAKDGMFMKEANLAMGYGPGGMAGTNPAAAMPGAAGAPGAMMGHGKPKTSGTGVIEAMHGHGAKKPTEKKAEANTQVDGADRTTRDYTGPLAAPRNALFGHGAGTHGTNESSKFDKNTAAQMGHSKTALSVSDLKDVLGSAGEGAKELGAKAKEVGQTAAEKAKEIGASAATGAQKGVDYLKEHPMAALGATGGAAYLGAKGLMRGGRALAGVPGRLRRKPKPPPGMLARLGRALAGAR